MPARPVDRGVRRRVDETGAIAAEAGTGNTGVPDVESLGIMSFCHTGAQAACISLSSSAQPLGRTRIANALRKDSGLEALHSRWLEGDGRDKVVTANGRRSACARSVQRRLGERISGGVATKKAHRRSPT